MVRFAAVALLALSAVASARPLRRQLTHDELVPRLIAKDLSEFDILPQLTVRELESIVQAVAKRATSCDTTPDDSTSANTTTATTGGAFKQLAYPDFQISSGVAGKADQEAAAILAVFDGVDKATISDADAAAIEAMREDAENAETDDFNPQIDAASGDQKTQLQTGKIKNKVLKLTLETFGLQIKLAKEQAAGSDTSDTQSQLDEENTKLQNNIKTDQASAGDPSLPAVL